MRIENWSVHCFEKKFQFLGSYLVGNVINHPTQGNARVVTTPIISVNGCKVITESGSCYELGKPDPKFAAKVLKQQKDWEV